MRLHFSAKQHWFLIQKHNIKNQINLQSQTTQKRVIMAIDLFSNKEIEYLSDIFSSDQVRRKYLQNGQSQVECYVADNFKLP